MSTSATLPDAALTAGFARPKPLSLRATARPPSRIGAAGLTALLLGVVALPSLPLYLLGASSMAAGVLLACLVALSVTGMLHADVRLRIGPQAGRITAIWVLVGLHFAVAMALVPVDVGKFAASWVLLLAFLLGARAVGGLVFRAPQRSLHKALRWVMAWLLLFAAGGLLGLAPPGSLPYGKPVFPFTEPSHFALSFVAFLLYFAVTARGWRRVAWVIIGAALALSLQNMTLLAGALLVALVSMFRYAIFLLPIAVVLLAPLVDVEYFVTRLDFSGQTDNLSSLVFVQGWQLIEESLRNSALWGIGFQQLGLRGTEAPISDLIFALMNTDVNLNDGGFTLSKLVSEFGVVGMLAAIAHAVLAWRCALRLREHASGSRRSSSAQRLARAIVVAFTLELLVRGAGYFTASSLLYAAALLYLLSLRFEGDAGTT